MKKMVKFLVLVSTCSALYGQQVVSSLYQNYVTKLQIANITSQGVELEWLSDIAPDQVGAFTIYLNPTNAISSAAYMRDSRVVTPSSFAGATYQNGLYIYKATLPITVSGQYYFAVAPSQGLAINEAIRRNLPYTGAEFNLLPELGYTIQPIAFQIPKVGTPIPSTIKLTTDSKIIVTSVRLNSVEDSFRLNWTAYPNNRAEYIFYVYRSRYPIADLKFRSPLDLPAYAVLTNKFSFEDQNIAFETPYYYAVVSKEAPQWQAGLNVFTTPAVLVRQAPPFVIASKQEFVRRSEQLAVQQSEYLSEGDIEQAVQQTLSNLLVAPVLQQSATTPPPTININPLSPRDFLQNPSNTFIAPGLSQVPQTTFRASVFTGTEDALLTESFYRNLGSKYNILIKTENEMKEGASRIDTEESERFLNDIKVLTQDIENFLALEDRIAASGSFNRNQTAVLASEYLRRRDQIRMKEFTLKNNKLTIPPQREKRRKELLGRLNSLHKSYNSAIARLKTQHKNQVNALFVARSEAARKQYDEEYRAYQKQQEEQWRQMEAQARANDVANRAQMAALGVNASDSSQRANLNRPKEIPLAAYSPPVFDRSILAKMESPSFYKVLEVSPPTVRLQGMDEAFLEEPIPTIEMIQQRSRKKEGWISQKQDWLQTNPNLWNENIRYWNSRVPEVVTNKQAFDLIQSRWGSPAPSPAAALRYGTTAYNRGDFAEAAYLLSKTAENDSALMMLGQSFYNLGAYKEAFSVFGTAYKMGVPGSEPWLLKTAQDLAKQ
ncbi:MAG: tetratricopeptide repeat protein [Brevinema sp.]